MIFAKKSLGQNFLISPRIVESIAAAGELSATDTVIEIGPGKGVLTKTLLATGARVRAIEKDNRLIPMLSVSFEREAREGRFDLVHGDIIDSADGGRTGASKILDGIDGAYKVIANIPYYVTGAIIRDFLSGARKPSMMVLMVQKEVADRIIARDGKESILSLSVKAYARPELVMKVSRGNFFPIPSVDSAVIRLSDIRDPFASPAAEERFFEIVKAGFAQKRKKLMSNLGAVMPRAELEKRFAELGIDENARAEDVGIAAWMRIASTA